MMIKSPCWSSVSENQMRSQFCCCLKDISPFPLSTQKWNLVLPFAARQVRCRSKPDLIEIADWLLPCPGVALSARQEPWSAQPGWAPTDSVTEAAGEKMEWAVGRAIDQARGAREAQENAHSVRRPESGVARGMLKCGGDIQPFPNTLFHFKPHAHVQWVVV